MRIPHSKLEDIRSNPKNHEEILKPAVFGNSKYLRWKNGINHYHKVKNLNKAVQHFINLFENNFVSSTANKREMEKYISDLEVYVSSFERLGNGVVKMNDRINISLKKGNTLYGEISRFDMTKKTKFEIYLIIKKDYYWQSELRFPIIQHYYAKKYVRSYEDISIGVYCIELGKHFLKNYSKEEIEEALSEIDSISELLN
ncbi:hypothetical protein AAON49_07345 [Pseudotenacibaculum sp. MALMAid0570]|uniref:hypothetical protein n=1 Tax=Pseudotenacibaculum sp. MALMAid0570 TaxID=3143938 RepID=UPI0032DF51A8